jgi:hypothetical protein
MQLNRLLAFPPASNDLNKKKRPKSEPPIRTESIPTGIQNQPLKGFQGDQNS